MILPNWLAWSFLGAGVVLSSFYGLKACDVFSVDRTGQPWAWRVHQFWFNFAGSAVGWGAAWCLAPRVWPSLTATSPIQLGWSDAAIATVAFVGITGHLPYATFGLIQGLVRLASKVSGVSK